MGHGTKKNYQETEHINNIKITKPKKESLVNSTTINQSINQSIYYPLRTVRQTNVN